MLQLPLSYLISKLAVRALVVHKSLTIIAAMVVFTANQRWVYSPST
jgi:hypothetical protein